MVQANKTSRLWLARLWLFLRTNKLHITASLLIAYWCIPYITTGSRIEWGDFTFFAQAYEAMRVSILHYHQFPWWNPWMSGGVPLYANPQMGVFSIQMLFVLVVGAPAGLKLALIVYTFAGYASMYILLRKYFRVDSMIATLLSLVWIFCTFFVSHLPAHFTFAWYMLAPLYFYFALTVKRARDGMVFGALVAVMALSQLHNPFFHIMFICAVIFAYRLVREAGTRRILAKSLVYAALAFLLIAGHRLFFTYQNVHEFPRNDLLDPTAAPYISLLGILTPISFMHPLQFLDPITNNHKAAPWGFGEVTACIGIFALLSAALALFLVGRTAKSGLHTMLIKYRTALGALGLSIVAFTIGLGKFAKISPYNIIKHIPVLAQMRVPSRWFIFFDLALIVFIGVVASHSATPRRFKLGFKGLLVIAVAELLFWNAGYQSRILYHTPLQPSKPSWQYPFVQTSYFGQTRKLSDGSMLPDDGNMPHAYREYEATRYNEGILYANDSLVQLALDPRRRPGHPTCPVEEGCNYIRSNNAVISYWSPNEVVLKRTAPGPIYINANDSSYFKINGVRDPSLMVAEPFQDFKIDSPAQTITIQADPSIVGVVLRKLHL